MRENSVKAKLAIGQPVFGAQIDCASPEFVEACGHLGFDYVFLDGEHGPLSEGDCAHLVRAAESANIVPLIRVPRNEPQTILRYLETGAMGIIVPHVNTAEEARRAVESVKYPPLGHRGIGYSRAAGFGLSTPGDLYRRRANEATMVVALLEDIKGVENLDEILAVEGLDVVFVGPGDLAASMGLPIEFDHPEVAAATNRIIERVVAAGRVAGVNAGPLGSRAHEHILKGAKFLVVNAWRLLAAGSRAYLEAARGV